MKPHFTYLFFMISIVPSQLITAKDVYDMTDICLQSSILSNDTVNYKKLEKRDTISVLPELEVDSKPYNFSLGKSEYYPSKREKNISGNAIALLEHMQIPQLSVNGFSVTTISGSAVSFFINGVEAMPEEFFGMNIGDVNRVVFIEHPTDPNYMGKSAVIDFIVKEYEYGGYTKAGTDIGFLGNFYPTSYVASKLQHKNVTYDVYFSPYFHKYTKSGSKEVEKYILPSETVERTTENIDRDRSSSSYPVKFRMMYRKGSIVFSNTIGFRHSETPKYDSYGDIVYNIPNDENYSSKTQKSKNNNTISYQGMLASQLGRGWSQTTNISFSCSRISNLFGSMSNEPFEVIYKTKERNSLASLYSNINKSLNPKNSLNAQIIAYHTSSVIKYNGSLEQESKINSLSLTARASYNYSDNQKYSINSGLGAVYYNFKANNESKGYLNPYAHFYINYLINDKTTWDLASNLLIDRSAQNTYNPEMTQTNYWIYTKGNPFLKPITQINMSTSYVTYLRNNLSLSLNAGYEYYHNVVRQTCEYMPSKNALLMSYDNSGDCNNFNICAISTIKFFNNSLTTTGGVYFISSNVNDKYLPNLNYVRCYLSVTKYLGNFYINGSVNSPFKGYADSQNKIVEKYPVSYYFSVGWGNGNLTASIKASNIFNTSWERLRQYTYLPNYEKRTTPIAYSMRQILHITLDYTFGYGKKINRSNDFNGSVSGADSYVNF